jgi:hypothetical protein
MKSFFTQQLIVNSLSYFVRTKLFCLAIAYLVLTLFNTTKLNAQAGDAVTAAQICSGIGGEPTPTGNGNTLATSPYIVQNPSDKIKAYKNMASYTNTLLFPKTSVGDCY